MKPAAERIRAELAQHGVISFARFMDLALYCPHCGYYEKKEDSPGKRGDFYTSVSVGPLFGELLAFQFADWFSESGVWSLESGLQTPAAAARARAGAPRESTVGRWPGGLQIVEAGAHDGRLAKDILTWLRLRRSELFDKIEYWIVEPSARRQEWQRETLNEFAPRVRWHASASALLRRDKSRITNHESRINGIIFANELLDAMPVHRIGWDAKRGEWFEWGVTLDQDQFGWTRLPITPHASRLTPQISAPILEILPDGFTTEICPAAENWWREAASWLKRGKLLTLDYGLKAEEFFAPQRADGTLRAYHRHRLSGDVLANPGEQDLTAHVNFSTIQQAGEAVGLRTESFLTQAQFLTGIGQRTWKEANDFGAWTQERSRQFQTLTHPEHLGRAFRVLVQSRDD